MWEIENKTPFIVAGNFLRNQDGKEVWVVVIKATYEIQEDQTLEIAEEQEEIYQLPQYLGEENKSSLLYDSDFFLEKPRVDIILNGSAYAPKGIPTEKMEVSLQIGSWSKLLEVVGDRFRKRSFSGDQSTQTKPFTKMDLIYERAWGAPLAPLQQEGGLDPFNPVGTGKRQIEGEVLPNLLDPKKSKKNKEPCGFGAIPRDWQQRYQFAGTYDDHWKKTRSPLLPTDFKHDFYQCAPLDQQIKDLQGGETVELTHFTESGELRFQLPKKQFVCQTQLREKQEHRTQLQTVILEPNVPRVIMLWQSSLLCHQQEHCLESTLVEEELR